MSLSWNYTFCNIGWNLFNNKVTIVIPFRPTHSATNSQNFNYYSKTKSCPKTYFIFFPEGKIMKIFLKCQTLVNGVLFIDQVSYITLTSSIYYFDKYHILL